jgi:hypothetical protein
MIKILSATLLVFAFSVVISAQVFKVPKDVFPLDSKITGFHGMLMIHKDKPLGVFIAYPDEKETMSELRERVAKYVLQMFFHKDGEELATLPSPQTSFVPSHKGDTGNMGLLHLYTTDQGQIQVLFYERGIQNKNYTYGYFVYMKKGSKADSKQWADEKGNGVKIFDEFWKTLSP